MKLQVAAYAYTNEERLRNLTIFSWYKAFLEGRETAALLAHVG